MREKWKACQWHYLLAAMLFLVAVWSIARMMMPEKSWKFDDQTLELEGDGIYFDAGVIAENAPGWYVDSSMEYGKVFAGTPAIDLPVGSYSVTIFYQSDGDGAQYI